MSEDLHNIDDLFKKGLDDHTEIPSSSVWDNIDKSLDKKKVIIISKKFYKLKWAAAILFLFSIGMAMYALHISKRNKELVRQNNERNVLKNRRLIVKSNSIPTDNTANNNNPALKNTNGKIPIQKEDSNNVSIKRNNKIILRNDRSTTVNSNSRERKVQLQTANTSVGNIMTHKIKKDKEQLPVKQPPAIVTESASPETTSPGNETETDKSIMKNANANKLKGKKITEESNNHMYPTQQKNIEGIGLLPELADVTHIVFVQPGLQRQPVLNNKLVLLKNNNGRHRNKYNLKNIQMSPFSATLFFSPDLISTNIRNDEPPRFSEDDRHQIKKEEKIISSVTIAALIDYKISKKLQLQSGITFTSWVTNIQPKKIYARPDGQGNINYRFNCSAGYSYLTLNSTLTPSSGDSIEALKSNNTLQYIGIPFELKYVITGKKFSIVPGLGLSANFLTKGQIKTTIATNTGDVKASSNSIEGLKSMYLAGLANIAFQYNLNKTLSIAFIPSARFSLSSINENAPVKTNLYSLGFGAGVIIKL